ncbi:MAG: hypothetical protein JNL58_04490 [Planctomyces sp.]|nr:hypothetical protein [Planctomyces sp.]
MNALETAERLAITGTDEQIVSVLKSLSRNNIPSAKVRLWLSDNDLLSWDGSSWFGRLEHNLTALPVDLQTGVRDLKARVLAGDPIRSAETKFGPRVLAIITGIAAAMPSIAGLVDSFYELDGGRPFSALTVAEFQAQRVAAESALAEQAAEEARQTARREFLRDVYNPAYNTHLAPMLDGGDALTPESMAFALEAMAAQIRGV